MENKKTVLITQPDLPDLSDVIPYLEKIWDKKWLTNNGEFHNELETKLAKFLGVPYLSLFSNGTLALITALQCLELTGEVITTPYSFVATTHSLMWNNIKPVFVDIDIEFGNIDTTKTEAAITPETTAILAVHVYGNPCDFLEIDRIAKKHNLKVIYDAAHAFGVDVEGSSVLNHGDLSILSFHATKVFNTFEGGAIISHSLETKKHIDLLKNFGILDENTIINIGINAKMNEFQAAIGLLQLESHNERIDQRKKMSELYQDKLKNIEGLRIITPPQNIKSNYAYFPILINPKSFPVDRNKLFDKLRENNIFVRKYFYPLISNLDVYSNLKSSSKENLRVANQIAEQVICLPIYSSLDSETITRIVGIIKSVL